MARQIYATAMKAIPILAFWAGSAAAGILSPAEITLAQTAEVAIAIAQDGWEHLVVQPAYSATNAEDIPRAGWLIALPVPPASHAFVPNALVVSVWRWLGEIASRPEPGEVVVGTLTSSPEVDTPPVVGGQYEAVVLPTLDALTAWLSAHGFASPSDVAKAYADEGWVFLAVVVRPRAGEDTLPAEGTFMPLRISFRSEQIIYPLRLSAGDGPFPAFLFVCSSDPINLTDAATYGFVPMEAAFCREQLDRLLWRAGVSEKRRASLWYAPERAAAEGPVEKRARWMRMRTRHWRTAPLNRRTAFLPSRFSEHALEEVIEEALAQNAGDAPEQVVTFYTTLLHEIGGVPGDSLYVSALCAPLLNVPGTAAELRMWRGDVTIRLRRDLLTPLPPLPPPMHMARPNSVYDPPRERALPPSGPLSEAFEHLLHAETEEQMRMHAREVLRREGVLPRVRFPRQFQRGRERMRLLSHPALPESLRMPPNDPSPAHTRSLQAFERAFRYMTAPLQAVWVAAQYTPSPADTLVALVRMRISSEGKVQLVRVMGNIPEGFPMKLFRKVVEAGVRLPPAPTEGVYDFLVVVEGRSSLSESD